MKHVAERSYEQLIARVTKAARQPSVQMETLGRFESGGRRCALVQLNLGRPDVGKLPVMIAAGIHGDEPAGVEAAIRFLETNAQNQSLLSRFHFVVFPCNNPSGWELNTRQNADGIDLNRRFATRNPPAEVAIVTRALQGRRFDLIFEMHEDVDASGFYLYEIVDDPRARVGDEIVGKVCSLGFPVNHNRQIEGMAAHGGVIRPRLTRFRKTRLPQAIYAHRTCGGHVLTLEPPASVLSLEDRVLIELTGLELALRAALGEPANTEIVSGGQAAGCRLSPIRLRTKKQ